MRLIGSAPTEKEILKLVTDYYCGLSIRIDNGEVFNSNGKIKVVRVVQKKYRFRFEAL